MGSTSQNSTGGAHVIKKITLGRPCQLLLAGWLSAARPLALLLAAACVSLSLVAILICARPRAADDALTRRWIDDAVGRDAVCNDGLWAGGADGPDGTLPCSSP